MDLREEVIRRVLDEYHDSVKYAVLADKIKDKSAMAYDIFNAIAHSESRHYAMNIQVLHTVFQLGYLYDYEKLISPEPTVEYLQELVKDEEQDYNTYMHLAGMFRERNLHNIAEIYEGIAREEKTHAQILSALISYLA